MPDISVIIPVYNGMPYLPDTLNSVLAQTGVDIEIRVLDDGSNDGSLGYLRSIEDPRLQVNTQPNAGLAATLNCLIAAAKSPIIARIDQDDLCAPERLAKQYQAMQQHALDVVFCHMDKIGAHGMRWDNRERQQGKQDTVRMVNSMADGCFVHSTLMARTEALQAVRGYRAAFYPSDDWDLQLRLSERGTIGLLQENLVQYRFHDQANTLATFFTMQDKRRWAEACHQARVQGQEEPDFAAHLQAQRRPFWRFVNRMRKDRGKCHTRMCGQHYLNGKRLRAVWHLLVAGLYMPLHTLLRLAKAVRR